MGKKHALPKSNTFPCWKKGCIAPRQGFPKNWSGKSPSFLAWDTCHMTKLFNNLLFVAPVNFGYGERLVTVRGISFSFTSVSCTCHIKLHSFEEAECLWNVLGSPSTSSGFKWVADGEIRAVDLPSSANIYTFLRCTPLLMGLSACQTDGQSKFCTSPLVIRSASFIFSSLTCHCLRWMSLL